MGTINTRHIEDLIMRLKVVQPSLVRSRSGVGSVRLASFLFFVWAALDTLTESSDVFFREAASTVQAASRGMRPSCSHRRIVLVDLPTATAASPTLYGSRSPLRS